MRNLAMRRWHPLHLVGVERKEIVSSSMRLLSSAIRHARRRVEGWHNLAWMNRTLQNRATNEGRLSALVVRDRGTSALSWEWGRVAQRHAEARGRRSVHEVSCSGRA